MAHTQIVYVWVEIPRPRDRTLTSFVCCMLRFKSTKWLMIYRNEGTILWMGINLLVHRRSPWALRCSCFLFYSTPGMRSSCEVVVFINLKKALSGKYLKFQYDFFSIIVFVLIIYRYLITVLHVQHFYQIKSTSFCVQAAWHVTMPTKPGYYKFSGFYAIFIVKYSGSYSITLIFLFFSIFFVLEGVTWSFSTYMY